MSQKLWEAYRKFTGTVSIYPDAGKGTEIAQDYAELGLGNEAGEVLGKVKKLLRDGNGDMKTYKPKGVDFIPATLDELGDVAFYAMRCLIETAASEEAEEIPFNKLWNPEPDLFHESMLYDVEELIRAAKELLIGIAIFIESGLNFDEIIDTLDEMARILGSDLQAVVKANIEKLSGRKERGTIKGDGDNR